jgi:hypothetical protein
MIPIVPLPAFPDPNRKQVPGANLRASNADRDIAADILCAAVADGRLTLTELDERLEQVLSARTVRELARLISDLPCALPRASREHPPARPRSAQEDRWSLLRSLLPPPAPGYLPA